MSCDCQLIIKENDDDDDNSNYETEFCTCYWHGF